LAADFEESLSRHSPDIRKAVMWRTANKWYQLGVSD